MYLRFCCLNAILLVESFDTSASLCSFLLACIERMALGTNFHVDLFLRRAYCKCVAAVAGAYDGWIPSFMIITSYFLNSIVSDYCSGCIPLPPETGFTNNPEKE